MFDAYTRYVSEQSLDERHADIEFFDVAGAPAVWIGIQEEEKESEWTGEFTTTTGLDLAYSERRCGGVLLLGIDASASALSYGNGYRLIPDELTDQRFGLSFLIRRLDGGQVKDLVWRRANARGRTDSTVVAAGAPVWMLGVAENVENIRRIGGCAKNLKVTFSSASDRMVNVEGTVGLRMRFGVKPDALVADIRECARVCREEEPDPALEFIEYVQPVSDADTMAVLDDELEKLLAAPAADVGERLIPIVPTSVLQHFGQAHTFTIRIGRARTDPVPSLELADILRRARVQRVGERVNALRCGQVYLNDDEAGKKYCLPRGPTKVVYAILMPKGRELTPGTLFPFSQATLAHAARILGRYGIDVEVVGIPPAWTCLLSPVTACLAPRWKATSGRQG
jgi:uncharacterized protein (TIGR04141 family)